MLKLFWVMSGGCIGAACRYGINLLAAQLWGSRFPWGTLAVNLAGCFLIGLIFSLAERVPWLTPSIRLFLVTGFLGAFTTFSSFAVETVNTVNATSGYIAAANFLANNMGGLILTLTGMWLARFL